MLDKNLDWKSFDILRACSFCGSPAKTLNWRGDTSVGCSNQECRVAPVTDYHPTREQAIAVWNNQWWKREADKLAKQLELLNDGASVECWLEAKAALRAYRAKYPVQAANAASSVATSATSQPRPSQ